MLKTILLLSCLFFTGCNYFAIKFTPDEIKKSVAIGSITALLTLTDPPTGEDLEQYLQANANLWKALSDWFEIE